MPWPRLRVLIAGMHLGLVGGCGLTLVYDDYGDQKTSAGNDAGCTPNTCASEGANCGGLADGCGTVLDCGTCTDGETCGAAGPNQCGMGSCTPKTCEELGAACGEVSDGCGNIVQCPECAPDKVCLDNNQCGCAGMATCASLGVDCGTINDGCGGTTECGNCDAPMICYVDGAGTDPSGSNANAGNCGCPTCEGTDADGVKKCGILPSCAGFALECGPCPQGQSCGGIASQGTPNVCG